MSPAKEEFTDFMNNIQVLINKDYKEDYREIAKNNLMNHIHTNKINIILMDYILGGQRCETGIGLATIINDERKNQGKDEIRIVFFSNTVPNNKRISDEMATYEKKHEKLSEWISKGYFGYEHFEEEYFKEKVIEKGIEKLLKKIPQNSNIAPIKIKRYERSK